MSILKAACIGIAGTFLALQFQNTRKEYGIYLGIAVSIFLFLGMSRNLSVIRETLELVELCKDRCGISDGNAENPGCDLSGGICGSNLQGCRLSDDRRADRGLCKAQYTCNRNADIKSTASCNPRTWTVKGKKNETLFSEIWHSMHDRTCNLRTDTAGTGICGRGRFLFGKQPDRR